MPGKVLRDSVPKIRPTGVSPLGRAILDKIDRGVVLLDATGALVEANALALKVLKQGDGICVRSGRFAFVDADLNAKFESLMALTGRTGNGSGTIAARIKRTNAAAYRIVVSAITANGTAHGAAYIALIYGPDERREISDAVLRELYGLTRGQTEVARRLHAGRSVDETASDLGLSPNTVRTHLKHIFSRCEVQSQAELMHLFALGPQRF